MEITKQTISEWLQQLQTTICKALEEADGSEKFTNENWSREEGGGGITKIINNGTVIEKGGVLYSAVHGDAPDFLFKEKEHSVTTTLEKLQFYATGVSIVIHPQNPMVPIIHMNIRYFEMDNGTKWLGGGIDLTPHYVVEDDAKFFHSELKKVCDRHHSSYYQKFKKWADDYFYIPHRKETRGIGGIFFDRLNSDLEMDFEQNFNFWKNVGENFAAIYSELIARNKNKTFTKKKQTVAIASSWAICRI